MHLRTRATPPRSHRDRLSGPRALRQPRHRTGHVRPRAYAHRILDEEDMEPPRAKRFSLRVTTVRSSASRSRLWWAAAVGADREGGPWDAKLMTWTSHRRSACADGAGARVGPAPRRRGHGVLLVSHNLNDVSRSPTGSPSVPRHMVAVRRPPTYIADRRRPDDQRRIDAISAGGRRGELMAKVDSRPPTFRRRRVEAAEESAELAARRNWSPARSRSTCGRPSRGSAQATQASSRWSAACCWSRSSSSRSTHTS